MKPRFTMRAALYDPNLLGSALVGPTWDPWRVLLIAALGEGLLRSERWTFEKLTGRPIEPGQLVEELWAIVGRRGGKSRAMSVLAAYLGGLVDHSDVLSPGEVGVLLCVAPDQRQAGIVLNYIEATLERSPILKPLIANRTADTIELTNGISIEVRASSFRRLRGPTYIGVICDEAAFFVTDEYSSNPDSEIIGAIRPGLSTTRGILAVVSSPYARKGELYATWRSHYGPHGDPRILVARAPSRELNPTLGQFVIDRAMARDPAAASAEYLAEFRSDVQAFLSREAIEAVVPSGVRERAPIEGLSYVAACDPSGGANDSFTLAIAHLDNERERAILDCVREIVPPFNPENATRELAKVIQSYSLAVVTGDRYGGEYPRAAFARFGIEYQVATKVKSDLYLELVGPLNAGQIELVDHPRLINQLCNLERRTARSGRDSIDHGPGGHDDVANAAASALYAARASDQWDQGIPCAPRIFSDERKVIWGD